MKYEKILAERPDKVIYKDGDNVLKVFQLRTTQRRTFSTRR